MACGYSLSIESGLRPFRGASQRRDFGSLSSQPTDGVDLRAKGVAFARRVHQFPSGAFSERTKRLFRPHGHKAWFVPAKSRLVAQRAS